MENGLKFGLFFFSAEEIKNKDESYNLLFQGTKYADSNGFSSVWTPERHFDNFGGLYPNPAIIAGALALETSQIRLCCGSQVLPIHSSLQLAENWSMVDNLSKGRIGVGVAPGWHPSDFVYDPTSYHNRKNIMYQRMEDVEKLWSGASLSVLGVDGKEETLSIFPKPYSEELPIWITSSGSRETWIKAGKYGKNVLTALLGQQTMKELEENIAAYKHALKEHGYSDQGKEVTVMVHTYLGTDLQEVKTDVKEPFTKYLKVHLNQYRHELLGDEINVNTLKFKKEDEDVLANFAFERYFDDRTLLGTKEKCKKLLNKLEEIGVTEVASLIDFGMENEKIFESLHLLNELKEEYKCILNV